MSNINTPAPDEKPEISPPASHWNDVLNREFAQESDRATVIVAVALLDSALETLLRSKLAPVPGSHDPLLDGAYAPLSNFSARIDLSYRLGLISAGFARDLHLIRRIRNDFAHNISGCSFEDSGVRHRVAELSRSSGLSTRIPSSRETFPPGIRGDFQLSVSWMQWYLRQLAAATTAIIPANPEWGYTLVDPQTGSKTRDHAKKS